MITKEKAVLYLVTDPTPIAYFNIYEEGDIWIKIKGCEVCPPEDRKRCCGSCPLCIKALDYRCAYHLEKDSRKPFNCTIKPLPTACLLHCYLEFECIKGKLKGKIRRIREPGNIFINENGEKIKEIIT